MRLDVSLGPGKLIVHIEPDIALVSGLGVHQLRIRMEVVGDCLAENTPVSLMGTLLLDGAGPGSYLGAWTTEEQVALRTFPVGNKLVASLTDGQLAAIERQRDGEEIAFRIDVNASISGVEGWPTGTVQGTFTHPHQLVAGAVGGSRRGRVVNDRCPGATRGRGSRADGRPSP